MRASWYRAQLLSAAVALLLLLQPGPALKALQAQAEGDEPAGVYPDVSVTTGWLAGHLGDADATVLDARREASYLAGHIPGAIAVPVHGLPEVSTSEDVRDVQRALGELGLTGTETLVCCGETSWSAEAATLYWLLELAGARHALVLDGGVAGWLADGNALSCESAVVVDGGWACEPHLERLATRDHVARVYGTDGAEIVDARGRYEWSGPIERDDWAAPPRVGHVPHALPYDFTVLLHPDGSLRDPAQTRSEFAKLGPRAANPVDLSDEFVVYGSGTVSDGAMGYLLLRRAGIERVRYYPGGWHEWSADSGLPCVRIIGADELMSRLSRGRRLFASDAPASGFAFFDVRHPADYARGHIRGSVSLRSDHFADSLNVKLDRFWPGIDREIAPVVTYCYGELCIRSRQTSTAAARAGFVRVERFYGGLDAWRAAGGKLVTSTWRG